MATEFPNFSANLNGFIARYPDIKTRALEEPLQLLTAAKERLVEQKIRAQQTTAPMERFFEEQAHREALLAYQKQEKVVHKFQERFEQYLEFITNGCHNHVRRFIDEHLPECDTFEKFVELVNRSHWDYMSENTGFLCTCSAGKEAFDDGDLLSTCWVERMIISNHFFIPNKGVCNYGTRMQIDHPERHFKNWDFLEDSQDFLNVVPLYIAPVQM
jgi:hypothetical protein